jgi:hypothetical protein
MPESTGTKMQVLQLAGPGTVFEPPFQTEYNRILFGTTRKFYAMIQNWTLTCQSDLAKRTFAELQIT